MKIQKNILGPLLKDVNFSLSENRDFSIYEKIGTCFKIKISNPQFKTAIVKIRNTFYTNKILTLNV